MNAIDFIINNRQQILLLAGKHGVITLKIYGSVLVRKETIESDIDFLAIFNPNLPYNWQTRLDLQDELETYFGRRIGIVDARKIPDVFRPAIDTDPIDIMELLNDKTYSITPKSSKVYFIMLDRLFRKYSSIPNEFADSQYEYLADRVSWWFSRLLRLNDNDLMEYNEFNYIEVLTLCEKLIGMYIDERTNEDLIRFQELLCEIKQYIQLRLPLY